MYIVNSMWKRCLIVQSAGSNGRSKEESVIDLLRPFLHNKVYLPHVAKTLSRLPEDHSRCIAIVVIERPSMEDLINLKVFPVASVAQAFGLRAAIMFRKDLSTHGNSNCILVVHNR